MSDLPPDAMETAWERSEGYECQGRELRWSRAHAIMAERIGLNMIRAMKTGAASMEGNAVTYDGLYEDIAILLYIASLDRAGLRKARRNPDAAKDAACDIFDDWDIPLSGPVFDKAQATEMEILTDVSESRSQPDNDNQEANDNETEKKH